MLTKLKLHIKQSKPFILIVNTSKQLVVPGFDGMALYEVIRFFIQSLKKGAILIRASSLAFNYILALFPGIIFLFTLIPYIPIDNFQEELLMLLEEIMPKNAYETISTTVEDLVIQRRGGLLSLGFIMALFFATNGVNSMINAFNTSYKTAPRSALMQRLIALLLTVILSSLLITAILLIIFSELAMDFLIHKGLLNIDITYFLLIIGKWVTILALIFSAISFLYYLGPSKESRWRFISAGSTLATMLTIVTSLGFSYFVNNFGQYNKLYGSIGTLMVIMLWLHFNSAILLIGFELNVSIDKAKADRPVSS
ncbi:MAG TPA: YihY/virulence factor BrkB family protein [Flavobacteriales bacterium]|nr:YihY/virulence factor BrkB family protein [Flavobacteriales bacterium]